MFYFSGSIVNIWLDNLAPFSFWNNLHVEIFLVIKLIIVSYLVIGVRA